jgi:hypothetical protein
MGTVTLTIFSVMSTSAQPIASLLLTPANCVGGHLSHRASDQYAHPIAGMHVVTSHQLHGVGHLEPTRESLYSFKLDTGRAYVDLIETIVRAPSDEPDEKCRHTPPEKGLRT